MRKEIPNTITMLNLTCGVCATWSAVEGKLLMAAVLICLGIFFDFWDGLAARALGVSSPLGKELDSLADVVTSGVAPAFILYRIFELHGLVEWSYLALLIPAASAYRLAKFNIDTRQSHSFLGLPVPANALIWTALGVCATQPEIANCAVIPMEWTDTLFTTKIGLLTLLIISIITAILMNSELPMFALKFKNLTWTDNKLRYIFLLTSALILVLFGVFGLAIIILYYIILSICTQKKQPSHE